MELENIVANTVLLKAREGKLSDFGPGGRGGGGGGGYTHDCFELKSNDISDVDVHVVVVVVVVLSGLFQSCHYNTQ